MRARVAIYIACILLSAAPIAAQDVTYLPRDAGEGASVRACPQAAEPPPASLCSEELSAAVAQGLGPSDCTLLSLQNGHYGENGIRLPLAFSGRREDCIRRCDETAVSYLNNGRSLVCCLGFVRAEVARYYPAMNTCSYCRSGQRLKGFRRKAGSAAAPECESDCHLVPISRTFDAADEMSCRRFCDAYGRANLNGQQKICSTCLFNGALLAEYTFKDRSRCSSASAVATPERAAGECQKEFEIQERIEDSHYRRLGRFCLEEAINVQAQMAGELLAVPLNREITPEGLRKILERISAAGISGLSLTRLPIGAGHLKELTALPNLDFLDISGTKIVDADLETLKGFGKLRILVMDSNEVGDAALAHLAGLTNLERLVLNNTFIRGTGLRSLHDLQHLSWLTLSSTPVTGEGLESLAALPALSRLDLAFTHLNDRGFQNLATIASLEELQLGMATVSPAGLRALAALPKLRRITISRGKLSDSDINQLNQGKAGHELVVSLL